MNPKTGTIMAAADVGLIWPTTPPRDDEMMRLSEDTFVRLGLLRPEEAHHARFELHARS